MTTTNLFRRAQGVSFAAGARIFGEGETGNLLYTFLLQQTPYFALQMLRMLADRVLERHNGPATPTLPARSTMDAAATDTAHQEEISADDIAPRLRWERAAGGRGLRMRWYTGGVA